jgi:flagellar hook-associated protein 3 FlgL
MTSYISTQSISSSMRQSILRMQSELAASQTEIATGNYADIGLTLGSRTGDSVSLQAENSLLQTITNTNQTVTTRLDTTQTILSGLRTSAQTLLNSLIEGTGSNTNASSIQASGQSDLQGLISGLNSTLSGDFIFAGTNTSKQPVTDYYATPAPNKSAVDSAYLAAFGMSQTSAGVSTISCANMQTFLNTQFAPTGLPRPARR